MIPTHISTLFLYPGRIMEVQADKGIPSYGEGFAHLDNDALGGLIFAPDRPADHQLIKLDDIKVDAAGILLEPLFCVTRVEQIDAGPDRHNWVTEWMANSDWADLQRAMDALYEIAKGHLGVGDDHQRWREEYHDDVTSFIGLWREIIGHGDWESGSLPELDGFDFEGEGKVVPV